MKISANLLYQGYEVKIGANHYPIKEVKQEHGLTRIIYQNKKGIMKSKSYSANDLVTIK